MKRIRRSDCLAANGCWRWMKMGRPRNRELLPVRSTSGINRALCFTSSDTTDGKEQRPGGPKGAAITDAAKSLVRSVGWLGKRNGFLLIVRPAADHGCSGHVVMLNAHG